MSRFFPLLLIASLFAVCLAGCGGSNGPVTVDAPSGNGYRVALRANPEAVISGGVVTLTAVAYNPDGSLVVTDEEGILFTANLSGSFGTDGKIKIANGTVTNTFTWNDNSSSDNPAPSRVLQITATYRGAATTVELTAVSKSF